MKRLSLRVVASLAMALLGAGLPLTEACAYEGHGGDRGGYHHHDGGPGWGGVVVGTGIGFGLGWMSGSRAVYAAPVYSAYPPGYGWVEPAPVIIYRQPPPVVVYREAPVVVYSQPAPPAVPEPIIYPRNGQGAQQTEADRQACNQWATTQRNAMGSSDAFNRATQACMDARGYTQR
jgi:hypothetical protein